MRLKKSSNRSLSLGASNRVWVTIKIDAGFVPGLLKISSAGISCHGGVTDSGNASVSTSKTVSSSSAAPILLARGAVSPAYLNVGAADWIAIFNHTSMLLSSSAKQIHHRVDGLQRLKCRFLTFHLSGLISTQ